MEIKTYEEIFADLPEDASFYDKAFARRTHKAFLNDPKTKAEIVHRDIKFYSEKIPLMMNVLIMLDDFTPDNGPTLILPYSHLIEDKPSDEYFKENSIQVLGKKGDILLFNSNIWHCSSENKTNEDRMAIPITFSKSVIKQLLDYPRALGYEKIGKFSDKLLQVLGYDSRVASNLEEWYQPFETRFYKKNQD